MKISSQDSKRALKKTDLLVVYGIEGTAPTLPTGVKLPAIAIDDFSGAFRQTRITYATSGLAARVMFVGLGKKEELDLERLRRATGLGQKAALGAKIANVSYYLAPKLEKALGGGEEAGQAMAEAASMASYAITSHKKSEAPKLKQVRMLGGGAAFARGVKAGDALGRANGFTRMLQDLPGNLMRPRDMVSEARKLAKKSSRVTATALTEAQMKKLGMGSLLSVSRGSSEPAFLIHMVYKPKGRSKGRVAIVGKGLTFDAGGISLKPSAKMDEMKYDMSGGAAVLGLFHALTELDVPYEVHGVVPTSENMPDAKATKPGDIVKAMNGKTIEVLNTDAEGRLILADALCWVDKKIKPDRVIDMATLTGAVIVALGHELTGMFSTTDALAEELVRAGAEVGEATWRLPVLDVHKKQLEGRVGDLRNINSGQGAGSTAGAAFLSHFVGEREWAHLDIAGTAWGTEDRDYIGGPMGSGVGVRLLYRFLANG